MDQIAVRATTIGNLKPIYATKKECFQLSAAKRKDLQAAETAKKARKLAASYGIEPSLVVRKATPEELNEFWGDK